MWIMEYYEMHYLLISLH